MSPRKAAALPDNRDLRAHLIATAERMLEKQDDATLTVRAIARAAGVADGVLYNHFADKEELLATALRAHIDDAHRRMGPLPEPGTATVAENLGVHVREGLAVHRAILPVLTLLLGRPALRDRLGASHGAERDWRDLLTDYLRAERDLGRLAPDADPEAAAAVLVGLCHDRVLAALLPGVVPTTAASVERVIATLLAGIEPVRARSRPSPDTLAGTESAATSPTDRNDAQKHR
ncbi:TetR/AcrR family transcriptional regulator [Nocardia bovistercoris]|uniref:TetR/AcrR family transcriptional regulator n=1 Tax=Nocardia bovistercoris TaxID=2785916 RepID=A0A931IG93_9NOCA|nr:TetR/AcrR family transcriptional regulator [Nocardia bovistercoris]MBH0779215.1 TetR/AcrR family transcriptional regulator [Nocardia bovistercoris]